MKGLKDFAMNLQIAWMSMELWKWQYDLMMVTAISDRIYGQLTGTDWTGLGMDMHCYFNSQEWRHAFSPSFYGVLSRQPTESHC